MSISTGMIETIAKEQAKIERKYSTDRISTALFKLSEKDEDNAPLLRDLSELFSEEGW